MVLPAADELVTVALLVRRAGQRWLLGAVVLATFVISGSRTGHNGAARSPLPIMQLNRQRMTMQRGMNVDAMYNTRSKDTATQRYDAFDPRPHPAAFVARPHFGNAQGGTFDPARSHGLKIPHSFQQHQTCTNYRCVLVAVVLPIAVELVTVVLLGTAVLVRVALLGAVVLAAVVLSGNAELATAALLATPVCWPRWCCLLPSNWSGGTAGYSRAGHGGGTRCRRAGHGCNVR